MKQILLSSFITIMTLIISVAIIFFIMQLQEVEYEFSVEHLDKAEIMLLGKSVKSIYCFNEYFDASGIKKYSCIIARKTK